MSYYLRVFGVEVGAPRVSEVRDWAEDALGSIETDDEDGQKNWREIAILDDKGDVVAVLTRDLVVREDQDSVGADDINLFVEQLDKASPRSAAEWVKRYLMRCSVVYCFQILSSIDDSNGGDVVREITNALRDFCGGISHAEGEGFSNEEGYQITWEFSEKVDGDCRMAVRDGGQWLKFRMNLANSKQRTAFMEGRCPDGAVLIED